MKLAKTCGVKLIIPEGRKQDVLETFKQYNFAVNFCVDKAWEPEKKVINKHELHKLTYYSLREGTDLSAALVRSARNRARDAVRLCVVRWSKRRKASKPVFKPFSAIQLDERAVTIKNRECTFSAINGRVKAKYVLGDYQKKILDDPDYEFRTGTLTFNGKDFFLNISVVKSVPLKESGTTMGVDLGINNIAVTSTGKFFKAGILNGKRRQYAERRARIQRKGTRSAHLLLKRMSRRENRFSHWVLHNISRRIVEEAKRVGASVIAMENLKGIREHTKKCGKSHRRRISLWAFSKLQKFIQYKALEEGIDVQFVDPKHTSQRCSKCGSIQSSNRNGSVFHCRACNYCVHADYNASKNIAQKGKSPFLSWVVCKPALNQEPVWAY
ncbi:transposase [Thermococcus sp.]|uniref:RNA-guided endonuclease InsQ/TnpB family protein n=1 Tax=Thermococcus sp. TaxID=35749 RepID=UPI002632A12F|nr:transposase [Thermococcus sp.]MCD6143130.1 transposase [Thermococcus sp.]